MITLVSSDQKEFTVDREVAERSARIRTILEGRGSAEVEEPIPLDQVSSYALDKVLEYCEHHRGEPLPTADEDEDNEQTADIGEWDREFIDVEQEILLEIILAAEYLGIGPLLDVGCKAVATMIKGKNPEEIEQLFDVANDPIPGGEAQIEDEHECA